MQELFQNVFIKVNIKLDVFQTNDKFLNTRNDLYMYL